MAATIRVPNPKAGEPGPWLPREGERFQKLIERLDTERATKTRDEAMRVVSKCISPSVDENIATSQLVLGQVQSGKTSNMVHAIGLAADNGTPLVIVLTGTKRILDSQTVRDLKRQLQSLTPGDDPWFNFREVGPGHDDFRSSTNAEPVLSVALDWFKGGEHHLTGGSQGFPLCVFLLKNTANMATFIESMRDVDQSLLNMPVLIIDDEADQAGPDGGKPDRPSATNLRIQDLRDLFPRHSYLLYTATPQAPLLSHLGNALSPEWVTNLQPGPDYVGISDLFPAQTSDDYLSDFRMEISQVDVQKFRDDEVLEVPRSLHEALAHFFVYGSIARSSLYGLKFATMMIHTSANNKPMEDTDKWVKSIIGAWKELFANQKDPDFKREWEQLFEPAWLQLKSDVSKAGKSLPFDSDELKVEIQKLLNRHNVKILNQKTANLLDDQWTGTHAWILIGGEKLSRGFRVENLIITYMPREKSSGDSALDTVQQRGRFFGYRKKYKELLKAWLPDGILNAFDTYRDHDEQLRSVLEELERNSEPLKSWKRVLLTNPKYMPTRRNVVKLGVRRLSLKPGGTAFSQTHLYVPGLAESTFPVYGNLLDLAQSVGLYKAERLGDGMQLRRAFAADLTYSQMLEFLLSYYNALAGPDSYELSNTLDQLAQFDEQSEQAAGCVVVFHESRELDGEEFSSTPDQRGPQGGTHPDFRESDVSESTPISGLSRSNAPDQTPKFKEDLPLKKFILHVYLFDVFRQAIKPGIRNTPFARNSPALRLQVPQLPLMSAVIQADAKN